MNTCDKSAEDTKTDLTGLSIIKSTPDDKVVALAGNPNVGKSTVFNSLTGMNQHTGNWPGKTVTNAQGQYRIGERTYILVDIPGTYSIMSNSSDEEAARNFICFGEPDAVVVVCDATCLERNMNLVLQILEITENVIVCVNLMDEAKKKNIRIDLDAISKKLGVLVIGTAARKKKSLDRLTACIREMTEKPHGEKLRPIPVRYINPIEAALSVIEPVVKEKFANRINSRWLSLKLLDYDEPLMRSVNQFLGKDLLADPAIRKAFDHAERLLTDSGISKEILRDRIVSCIILTSEDICLDTVHFEKADYDARDRKIDRLLTGKLTGFPIMAAMLLCIFWLTITGANYPSQLLADGLFRVQDWLTAGFLRLGAPQWLHGILILGVYRVLAWVVSVMLPPMAIFFPLFTLLEDLGYLPRVAFNLDKQFKKCCACGKQALTMCMGFGCNAAGITGCRIIDSPRERLIAIITNNFVPCNGRFPTIIAILTMFFVGTSSGIFESIFTAALLTLVILLGVMMTFFVSKLLSKTILKGVPSSFTLELPPYRKPQVGKVIVRSICDRTLFVLARAVVVAAPAGLVIWIMANVTIGDTSLLLHCSGFLDPFAKLLGLDGVILLSFILGFPANEIVVPIMIMAYMSTGSLVEFESLSDLKQLLIQNHWTWVTAISTMLFSLMHWPCSTTCLTIKKETQSLKWTVVSFLVPTVMGVAVCFLFASLARLLV
ncbi:MAG: ferrous iron transport protein B [Oscillospiraceae bacterium]